MKFEDYQTAVNLLRNIGLTSSDEKVNYALGLAGESGEIIDLIKKEVFHLHDLDEETIIEELGDLLWYVTALASTYAIPLGVIAEANIYKLQRRYPNGFSVEDSRNRDNDA